MKGSAAPCLLAAALTGCMFFGKALLLLGTTMCSSRLGDGLTGIPCSTAPNAVLP